MGVKTYDWASLVTHMVKNPPTMRETWIRSLGWEDPLEKGTVTHSSILTWRIPRTVSPWGPKESDTTERLSLLLSLQYYQVALVVKNPPASADLGLIPGLRRALEGGNGTPLQCPCLENPMGRGAWWATVHGVTKSQTQLSD